ncbi:hypothetical protein EIP91_002662 [Steccherinum ochraceum]|uniref:NAD(P)-binding protein n=1 Tax=Steccherinum ochraceum TaxID=92696 RepID=A0A4R0RK98_9APHY|nr:hypothetical protein EIP91_002662 [Steccherinum ochraceum]
MNFFFSNNKWDMERGIPDLSGKVIIVTGGNSGLGFESVKYLAAAGAKVYMGARSEQKAKDAMARIDEELGKEKKGTVEWLELDLSDSRKAKAAAETFVEKENRLDVLMNNAALTVAPYKRSIDDIQDVMMVNHVSPFVFTMTLLPLLKRTAKEPNTDVRIVNLSSAAIGYTTDAIRFRNKEDFNDEHAGLLAEMKRYGRSKLANILFTKELQRQLDAENVPIIAISLHPGAVNTEGNRRVAGNLQNPVFRVLLSWATTTLMTAVNKGAYTQVFAAVAPIVRERAEQYKGVYLTPPAAITTPNKAGESKELAEELWKTTEGIIKEIGV